MSGFKLQNIEPYPATLTDNGFKKGWMVDPAHKGQLLVVDLQTRMLEKFGTFEYFGVKKDPNDYTDEDKAERKRIFEDPESAEICKKLAGKGSAETWWVGGMQKNVVKTVHLIMDDPDSGIFIFYAAMNSPKHMQFLGRLDEGTELYDKAFEAFCQFARDAIKE